MVFPRRFSLIGLLLAVFMSLSTLLRIILYGKALHSLGHSPLLMLKVFGTGLFFDLVTFAYWAIPLLLVLILLPDRAFNSKWLRPAFHAFFFIAVFALLFDVAAEYTFFDEFGTRFNFIAVDYLIYTNEVLRNITESYPLGTILAALVATAAASHFFLRKLIHVAFTGTSTTMQRVRVGLPLLALPLCACTFVSIGLTDISTNPFANEVAGNGLYNLVAAFRNNELDYDKFYVTRQETRPGTALRQLVSDRQSRFVSDNPLDITRKVTNPGPEKKHNVIVIVEESLSAEYLGAYGNKKNLTPNLDRLAKESLLFTHLYAAGTRTVRGLEALTLSMPPLPGTSIVKRPDNGGFHSWGTVMREKGYDTKFIYAGYGYFDNMNAFFAGNGFNIVDRGSFSKDEVTFANVWGVCDEDLFRRVIAEGTKSHRSGKPFFSVVMTTSNHRPFTYPEGKIDIPSHSGRKGGVKYADHAIGRLIEEAAKQPWFNDTLFVIVADHCASSAGKTALPVKKYEIPLLVYAPKLVKPQRVDTLMSQIDVAPTVLGLLNFSYTSCFFGKDILRNPDQDRAFICTYQKLGYIEKDQLAILDTGKRASLYSFTRSDGSIIPQEAKGKAVEDMIAYYQGSNYIYTHRMNRVR